MMSSLQSHNSRRRRNYTERDNNDFISNLPDYLILHILSLLPIQDAIKTQVLSKRWLYLSTSLPTLFFHYRSSNDNYEEKKYEGFVAFVDKTLILSNCPKLNKFGVNFEYDTRFASNVNLWTRAVVGKGTEELHLQFQASEEEEEEAHWLEFDSYVLPQLLFTNSLFRELSFSLCSVLPKGVVVWKSLKKLSFRCVNLSNGVIENILGGSPVLETFELKKYNGVNRLDIINSSLKKLIVSDFEDDELRLEISTPNLQSLEISGRFDENGFQMLDASSLVEATLDFDSMIHLDYEWHRNVLMGFLESFANVKILTLGNCALQILSIMERKGLRSPLLKCVSLTLDTSIKDFDLPGIASLLESCCHLETLIITPSSSSDYSQHFWEKHNQLLNFNGDHYWTSQKRTFKCLTLNLKTVKFTGLMWDDSGFHLSFVQFLLKNARVLQKMAINTLWKYDTAAKEILEEAQNLINFPRSSPNAVVTFN